MKYRLSDNPRFKRIASRYPATMVVLPMLAIYWLGIWYGESDKDGGLDWITATVLLAVFAESIHWFNRYFNVLIRKNPTTYWYLNVMQGNRLSRDHKYSAQLVMPDNAHERDVDVLTWWIDGTAIELMMAPSGTYVTLRNTETGQTMMLTNKQALHISSALMTGALLLESNVEDSIYDPAKTEDLDPTIGVRVFTWIARKLPSRSKEETK